MEPIAVTVANNHYYCALLCAYLSLYTLHSIVGDNNVIFRYWTGTAGCARRPGDRMGQSPREIRRFCSHSEKTTIIILKSTTIPFHDPSGGTAGQSKVNLPTLRQSKYQETFWFTYKMIFVGVPLDLFLYRPNGECRPIVVIPMMRGAILEETNKLMNRNMLVAGE